MATKASRQSNVVINDKVALDNGRIYELWSFQSTEAGNPYAMSAIREAIIRFAKQAGIAGNDLSDIQIALGEALDNAVEHGSPIPGVSMVGLGCEVVNGCFIATISDEGKPFDYRGVPEPVFEDCPECGLGIFLMRQVMDCVQFCRSDVGNSVRLVKKLGAAA